MVAGGNVVAWNVEKIGDWVVDGNETLVRAAVQKSATVAAG